jgi:hypothetical protein
LIFYYASVLFLCPEVFTELGMRPGQHWHMERATGCSGGTTHAGGSTWLVASMGNSSHGQAMSGLGSGNGDWAGYCIGLGSKKASTRWAGLE